MTEIDKALEEMGNSGTCDQFDCEVGYGCSAAKQRDLVLAALREAVEGLEQVAKILIVYEPAVDRVEKAVPVVSARLARITQLLTGKE
jgi:hypothetical protein